MKFIADLHIHSKYSRSVSQSMVPEELDRWADDKGILVMGTGDFTHPAWFKDLKEKLEPAEQGLFILKPQFKLKNIKGTFADTRFLLSVEISSIYSKGGKTRRVHNIIFAPDFLTAEKINTQLGWIGNLKSDGRPILGLDCEELAKIVFNINPEAVIVPAHCLLSGTLVHTKDNLLKPIQDITKGDFVITHKNRWRKVNEIFKRPYNGKVYHIKPRYLSLGLTTTAEHPFYAIKTHKNCHRSSGICKPSHIDLRDCKRKHFKSYKPQWIMANQLEKGDVLIYPRFKEVFTNYKVVDLKEILNRSGLETELRSGFIIPVGSKITAIKQFIPVDKNFCKLVGYYLSEGYTNGRDLIGFAFSAKETHYVNEVIVLMKEVFGFDKEPKLKINKSGGVEILFYSKILYEAFRNLFYYSKDIQNASTKALPVWALGLSHDLQVEIFRCWWRGDAGYTVSRMLLNQMKMILLRLIIIQNMFLKIEP
ncbi:MAG: Mja hyp1 intein [Parcubacteria group bacterium Athens1014_26]|nr:MAG: Mja hyp1 intein [Parcubacteria group bacterium Athens1014_26]